MEPTTRVEAINAMLESIGERPVADPDNSGRLDVVRARNALDEINRLVQSSGWWFNRIEELELTPAASEVVLPTNTLKVLQIKGTRGLGKKTFVMRRDASDAQLKLYSIRERTFVITDSPITVDLVEGLDFEDLPETARRYIAMRAAITFQARSLGSQIIHRFEEFEAQSAWTEFLREDAEFEATQGTLNEAPLTRDLLLLR